MMDPSLDPWDSLANVPRSAATWRPFSLHLPAPDFMGSTGGFLVGFDHQQLQFYEFFMDFKGFNGS